MESIATVPSKHQLEITVFPICVCGWPYPEHGKEEYAEEHTRPCARYTPSKPITTQVVDLIQTEK